MVNKNCRGNHACNLYGFEEVNRSRTRILFLFGDAGGSYVSVSFLCDPEKHFASIDTI